MINFKIGPSSFNASADGIFSWTVNLPNSSREILSEHGISTRFPFYNSPKSDSKVINQTSSSLSTQLMPSRDLIDQYPHDFTLITHYTFTEFSITINLELENLSDTSIPWAPSISFLLPIPWHTNLALKHYQLNIPAKTAFYINSDDTVTRTKDFEQIAPLDDPRLNNIYLTNLKNPAITLGPNGGEENTTIFLNTFSSLNTVKTSLQSNGYKMIIFMNKNHLWSPKKHPHSALPHAKNNFSVTISLN